MFTWPCLIQISFSFCLKTFRSNEAGGSQKRKKETQTGTKWSFLLALSHLRERESLTVADRVQSDCFGDLLLEVWCAGLPADFGLEQRVDKRGFPQTALTYGHVNKGFKTM